MSSTINEINRIRKETDELRKKLPSRSLEVKFDHIINAYEKIIEELLMESNYTGR
jgi:hypothetical protein